LFLKSKESKEHNFSEGKSNVDPLSKRAVKSLAILNSKR